ncbi:MAG: bifunctional phosphoribosylaminoimidazolecarboxamide formyltransferase/IMP cyclohydrolase, partial [Symbiobacteriaceae bacterium]|nr:bifunctional phosphoribosylaminoimidazolecarboxamide formyltransferase/IMP cyclohydrolase [Symbiobacteriaceae bacterium]
PCAAASASSIARAFAHCYAADPVSIYGGVVALNRPLDRETAEIIKPLFLDMILAPSISEEVMELLVAKRNTIILSLGDQQNWSRQSSLSLRSILGGYLVQSPDAVVDETLGWKTVSQVALSAEALEDALFAWRVVKHMRSNAIVVCKDRLTLGLGQGQVNRVEASRQALAQAGDAAKGAVLASDGFFPFDDSLWEAGSYGITTIIEPGGSIRDEHCIKAANELGVSLVFTGIRHFKH